jgi:hypothetical protein
MDKQTQQYIADALRATADLVERGLIQEGEIRIENEVREVYGTYVREIVGTGWQTVTIVLQGNPQDFSTPCWSCAGLSSQAREICAVCRGTGVKRLI